MMAKSMEGTPSNGTNGNNGNNVRWLGVPVVVWIETIRTLGLGGIVMVGVLYLLQQTVPSLAEGHMEFLRTTSRAVSELKTPIENLDKSASKLSTAAEAIQSGQEEAHVFFGQVRQEHQLQSDREEAMLDDHKRAIQALTEIKATVEKTNNGG
jgi:hypothetical protein